MPRGGKRHTSFDPERAREAARRSAEVRRRKSEEAAELEPLTDREQALAALRRSLDSNNAAAVVAAGKALIDLEPRDPRVGMVSVEDARAQLEARLNRIEDHRRRAGQVCPTCGAVLQVERADGREGSPSRLRSPPAAAPL
jgi:hypothetical protein